MNEKQHMLTDSINCVKGLLNGMIISLPFWGLIYLFVRVLHG